MHMLNMGELTKGWGSFFEWIPPPNVFHSHEHCCSSCIFATNRFACLCLKDLTTQEEDQRHGFASLVERLRDGTLLCDVAGLLRGWRVAGVCRRPMTQAARAANILNACSSLRKLPKMSWRLVHRVFLASAKTQ